MAQSSVSSSSVSFLNSAPKLMAPSTNSDNNNNNQNHANDHDEDSIHRQLAADLEQFLQNPTLRKALEEKGSSLDLQLYAATIESELEELEETCIAIYQSKATEIQELRDNLSQASQILKMIYEMLITFQNNIGSLSIDIRQLQSQLQMIDVQLDNRRSTVQQLQNYLQHIIVAPTIVNTIMYDPVNTTHYVAAVQEIQQLFRNCALTTPTTWSAQIPVADCQSAGHEMKRELISLQNLASQRIREYFLQQMTSLQRPTHIRFVQVHNLLKYSALYDFLEDYAMIQMNEDVTNANAKAGTTIATANTDATGTLSSSLVANSSSTRTNTNVANEIYHVYIEIMSNILKQLFRTYSQQLLALDYTKYHCTKNDVIAIDAHTLRESVTAMMSTASTTTSTPTFSSSATTPASSHATSTKSQYQKLKRMDPFSLNTRANDVLGSSGEAPVVVAAMPAVTAPPSLLPRINVHVSLLQKEQYPYERLYGSLLGHLLDAVTNEYIFTRQFFKRTSTSGRGRGDETFNLLFGSTITLLLEQIENYLFTCYDTICLLLMIHITHSIRSMARQRKIYVLENFLDQLVHLLWPRLKIVIDHHYRSIQNATAVSLEVTDAHTASHYVSRRFAEFCCSILLIMHHNSSNHQTISDTSSSSRLPISPTSNKKGTHAIFGKGQPHHDEVPPQHHQSAGSKLLQDVSDMIDAYIQLLERVSEVHTSQKKRIVFLINNLDQVACIFQERRVTGKECNKILEHLLKYREDYVEEELLTGFSKMIAFVQQTESHMASVAAAAMRSDTHTSSDRTSNSNNQLNYDVNPSVVESLVLDFASNWKTNIDQINRNVLSYFSNFRNGMEILKHCLTQLLLYYTRFQDIIRKVWKKSLPPFTKDFISTNAILAEIKRYALAI